MIVCEMVCRLFKYHVKPCQDRVSQASSNNGHLTANPEWMLDKPSKFDESGCTVYHQIPNPHVLRPLSPTQASERQPEAALESCHTSTTTRDLRCAFHISQRSQPRLKPAQVPLPDSQSNGIRAAQHPQFPYPRRSSTSISIEPLALRLSNHYILYSFMSVCLGFLRAFMRSPV